MIATVALYVASAVVAAFAAHEYVVMRRAQSDANNTHPSRPLRPEAGT